MRKILVLLLAAAVVGIVFSRGRDDGGGPAPAATSAAADPGAGPSLGTVPQAGVPSGQAATRLPVEPPARPAPQAAAPAPEPAASAAPVPTEADVELEGTLQVAREYIAEGERAKARKALTDLYLESRGDRAQTLRALMDEINADLVFDPRCLEGADTYTVEPGDSLAQIGKKLDVSWRMLARINELHEPYLVKVGQLIKVLRGEPTVFVCRGDFRLALLHGGHFIKEYPIGIGVEDRTPVGTFTVATLLVEPRWYAPGGGIYEYGDPENLLGERWIGFRDEPGATGIGIHGSRNNEGIGTKCSNGCLRMRNDDVVELYDFAKMGMQVTIID